MWGAVAGAGGAAGVLLGGILTTGLSWRWVLFVNVPIGLVCAMLAPRLIGESRADVEAREFDLPGAVTVTAGLALLVYALVDAVNAGWGSAATIGRLVGASVLLATFTRPHEAGLASGLVNTAQQVGGALGLALLATVANARTHDLLSGGRHDLTFALTKGFDRAFLVGAGFALLGALLTLILISSRDSRSHSRAARGGEESAPAVAG